MKRSVIAVAVFVISLIVVGSAFAVEGYGSAGCGLGSLVFGDEPGMVQVFAATTNGTSASQTFGITSGTSNCEKQPKFSSNERLNQFVMENMDNLAKDVAMGYGEFLETLVELLGVTAGDRTEVYARLQANFSSIFSSERIEAADVIDSIITVING